MKTHGFALLGILLGAAVLGIGASAQTDADRAERWGGRDVSLQMTASGASIEFACGHGEITQSIRPNAAGEFSVTGTYTPEMGGPVRRDNPPRDLPATYRGVISGDTMQLEVLLEDKDRQPPPFTLRRGYAGKIVKCR